eukprot:7264005-Prymnesium_polylepis.1
MRAVTLTHTCIVPDHTVNERTWFKLWLHERAAFSARSNMSIGSCSWSTCNMSTRKPRSNRSPGRTRPSPRRMLTGPCGCARARETENRGPSFMWVPDLGLALRVRP